MTDTAPPNDVAFADRVAQVYFERWELPIQRYHDRVERRWLKRLLLREARTRAAAPRVLIAGCGGARELRVLQEVGATVTAIDYSPEAIRVARERWGDAAAWQQADVHHLESLDSNYDVVICLAALLNFVDPPLAVRNFFERLRPGGLLVVSTVNAEHPTERNTRAASVTRRAHSLAEFSALVEGAGFAIERTRGLRVLADRLLPTDTRAKRAALSAVLLAEPLLRRLRGPRGCKWLWLVARRPA